MTKTASSGRFLRYAGMGFATLCFAGLLATGPGCLPAASNDSNSGGSSGSNSSSGNSSSGGSSSSSSSSNNGGSSSSSSSSSSASGGSSAASSSKSSSGGSSGGSSSSSSSSASGGSSAPASSAAAGSSGSTPTGTDVTFNTGKGVGAMTGYGWIAFGSSDTVSDPLCGTEKFTSTTKCAQTTWSTKDGLCISASIPALPASPTSSDYTNNWGVQVGLDATEAKGTLGQSFSSVTIKLSGSPTSGLRAKLHRKGDAEGADFCAEYKSGAISFTSFTKECWSTTAPGTAITAADVPNIDQIGVQVPSGSAAITVSSLCITGITFAK